jgi:Asp-tRNA(Asn)/Glu-tRNA(Gln) amidotransferase A subunit family amidase
MARAAPGAGSRVNDILRGSAADMARAVRDREISPVELVQAHIDRAEEMKDLNIVVLPRYEKALEEARLAESELSDAIGIGPLHGVPFTAKECIEVAGMPCTDGSKIFEGYVSTQDATVITNLRQAGAILIGKTNIPEFAMHYDSNNLVYGATRNPHDPEHSAGGSSGGEGAALATGITPIGVGSDYGGSIRVPAHFNGVVGLRPGRWVVPYAGHFPHAQVMTVQLWSEIGPMARYVDDLQLLLPIFARPDPTRDPDVMPHRVQPDQPQELGIAVFSEDGLCPVHPALRDAVERAGNALAEGGHEVVEDRPPHQSDIREIFEGLALAETAALLGPVAEPRKDELSPQIQRLFRRVERADTSLAGYAGRLAARVDLERAVCEWLEQHQIAICPVSATPAFPLGTETLDVEGREYEEVDLFSLSTFVNAMGLPAAAVPVGRTDDGLPIAVQVIGRRYREMEVLAIAKELEEAFGGWIEPDLARASAYPV